MIGNYIFNIYLLGALEHFFSHSVPEDGRHGTRPHFSRHGDVLLAHEMPWCECMWMWVKMEDRCGTTDVNV